jgi:hypothetical protein
LNIIRKPTLKKKVLKLSVWKIPVHDILTKFATLPTNLVVIGDRRLTFAYAKHEIKTYTTGNSTGVFSWEKLIEFLERSLKQHATIGARILIYHHKNGFIGTARKMKKKEAFFVPIGIS